MEKPSAISATTINNSLKSGTATLPFLFELFEQACSSLASNKKQ